MPFFILSLFSANALCVKDDLICFVILRNLQVFKKYFLTKLQINILPEFMKFSYNFIFAHHFFAHLKVHARKEDP